MQLEKWIEKHLSYKKGYYTKITNITSYYKKTHPKSRISMKELKRIVIDKFGTSVSNSHLFQDVKGNKVRYKKIIPVVVNNNKYDFVDRYAKEYKISERSKKMEMIQAYVADIKYSGNQETLIGINRDGEILGRFVIPFVKSRLFEELEIRGTSIIGERLVFRGSRMENENYIRVSEVYSTQEENDEFSLTLQNIYGNVKLNNDERRKVYVMNNSKELYTDGFHATNYIKDSKVKERALNNKSEYFLSEIGYIEQMDRAELNKYLNRAGLITRVKGKNKIILNVEHPELYTFDAKSYATDKDGNLDTSKAVYTQKFTEMFKQLFLQSLEEYKKYLGRNAVGN